MLRSVESQRRSGHAEQLDETTEVFIHVTTPYASSPNRLPRPPLATPLGSVRTTHSAPACVPGAGKGGESRMFKSLVAHSRREDGQTMAEYGVVLAVIAIGVVAALLTLSGAISTAIDTVSGYL